MRLGGKGRPRERAAAAVFDRCEKLAAGSRSYIPRRRVQKPKPLERICRGRQVPEGHSEIAY